MKQIFTLFTITLLTLSFQAHASDTIGGKDGVELYKFIKTTFNAKEMQNGDSSESGCYNMTEMNFMGMECVSESCTSEETYERVFYAACYLDELDGQQLSKIKNVLEASGLNPKNEIFKH